MGSERTYGVTLGDLDADGDLDAFVANRNDQADQVWLNDGGDFTDSGQVVGSYHSIAAALGDVDADGDLDAFVTDRYAANRVWINQKLAGAVSLSIDNSRIDEAAGTAIVSATLTETHSLPVVVDLETGGTATAGDDYLLSADQIVIPPGSLTEAVSLEVIQDLLDESDETVIVEIAAVTNGIPVGTQQVTATIVDDDDVPPSFAVTWFQPTDSGFRLEFNGELDPSELNLYDTQDTAAGIADVVLTGATAGDVAGSLITEPSAITFLKSGGPLAADTYTVTLRSAADGFKDTTAMLLDGDGDGTGGDNYVADFTFDPPPADARTIHLPDFVRGPGQDVNLPADATAGIPISINNGDDVQTVELQIHYDPELLEISGATAAAGGSVVVDVSTPGVAILILSRTSPLPVGESTFLHLQASVPSENASAIYGKQHVLDLNRSKITNGAGVELPLVENDALHVASFSADVSSNGGINANDASQVARVAASLDSGFAKSLLTDSVIIGDITGNGRINATDAAVVARYAAELPVDEIPPIPSAAAARSSNAARLDSLLLPDRLHGEHEHAGAHRERRSTSTAEWDRFPNHLTIADSPITVRGQSSIGAKEPSMSLEEAINEMFAGLDDLA